MEHLLEIYKSEYGQKSQEGLDQLCEMLNMSAMFYLQKENYETALNLLQKSEMLSQTKNQKALTYNNLACYYRRTGKLRTALQYLINALGIEIKIDSLSSIADTHLNLCAVLSQLQKHQEALEHILLSIIMLQDEFLNVSMKYYRKYQQQQQNKTQSSNNSSIKVFNTTSSQQSQSCNLKINEDRLAVLTIAYHNLGVELEHLKRRDESIQIYKKALNFAQQNFIPGHQLIQNLQNVLQQAKNQAEQVKSKKTDQDQIKINLPDYYNKNLHRGELFLKNIESIKKNKQLQIKLLKQINKNVKTQLGQQHANDNKSLQQQLDINNSYNSSAYAANLTPNRIRNRRISSDDQENIQQYYNISPVKNRSQRVSFASQSQHLNNFYQIQEQNLNPSCQDLQESNHTIFFDDYQNQKNVFQSSIQSDTGQFNHSPQSIKEIRLVKSKRLQTEGNQNNLSTIQ